MKTQIGSFKKILRTWGLPILAALTVRWGVAEAYVIPSSSMEPTLQVSDRIFVNKLAYGIRVPFTKSWIANIDSPHRGDVVVFRYPLDESTFFVKRVIGISGDTIEIDSEGRIHRNGISIDESQYELKWSRSGYRNRAFGPLKVPEGHLFVMGDNRDNSNDSRVWGFLPTENVLGRAEKVWWGPIR